MENRFDIVVSVGALAQDAQSEVDLGVCPELNHRPENT
jgi:hypothetical protein